MVYLCGPESTAVTTLTRGPINIHWLQHLWFSHLPSKATQDSHVSKTSSTFLYPYCPTTAWNAFLFEICLLWGSVLSEQYMFTV